MSGILPDDPITPAEYTDAVLVDAGTVGHEVIGQSLVGWHIEDGNVGRVSNG